MLAVAGFLRYTNVQESDLAHLGIASGDRLRVEVKGDSQEMPFVTAFGDVTTGHPLAYIDSDRTLAFALNMGNFVQANNWTEGLEIRIRKVR